jgi:hypothetical protein
MLEEIAVELTASLHSTIVALPAKSLTSLFTDVGSSNSSQFVFMIPGHMLPTTLAFMVEKQKIYHVWEMCLSHFGSSQIEAKLWSLSYARF